MFTPGDNGSSAHLYKLKKKKVDAKHVVVHTDFF
jgi:hypothetical protein